MTCIIWINGHVRPCLVSVDIHAAVDHIRSTAIGNTAACVVNVHTDDGFLLLQPFFFCGGRHTEVDGLHVCGHGQPAGIYIRHVVEQILECQLHIRGFGLRGAAGLGLLQCDINDLIVVSIHRFFQAVKGAFFCIAHSTQSGSRHEYPGVGSAFLIRAEKTCVVISFHFVFIAQLPACIITQSDYFHLVADIYLK